MVDNTPLPFIVENTDIRLDLLFVLPDNALPTAIPDHDAAIVAFGEAEAHPSALARIAASFPTGRGLC